MQAEIKRLELEERSSESSQSPRAGGAAQGYVSPILSQNFDVSSNLFLVPPFMNATMIHFFLLFERVAKAETGLMVTARCCCSAS